MQYANSQRTSILSEVFMAYLRTKLIARTLQFPVLVISG